MGSEGSCPPPCQKLLLCSGCAAYVLLVLCRAMDLWKSQGNHLPPEFKVRTAKRLHIIQIAINECFARIGYPMLPEDQDFDDLAKALLRLSGVGRLADADSKYCIERADICEKAADEIQQDYLATIGYAA